VDLSAFVAWSGKGIEPSYAAWEALRDRQPVRSNRSLTHCLQQTGILPKLCRDFWPTGRRVGLTRDPETRGQSRQARQRRDSSHHRATKLQRLYWLAGAPGFEPGDGGIKIRCLTTWLRPKTCTGETLAARCRPRLRGTIAARADPINAAFPAQTLRLTGLRRGVD
jgi:hypothetical protein